MVSLTFYGGVKEIGGNKILLEDQDTKVFLDFGMSFGKRGQYFEEFLTPRTANGLGDFLELGLVPDIPGVYRSDLLEHLGRKLEEPEVDAVLLSHSHADHANYISFLHEDIPVYCGKTTLAVLEAVQESSQRSIENEIINFKKRPLFRKDYKKPPVERKFHTFRTGEKVRIGSLEVEPVHVDHSVPGAYGFIIHASDATIVYTGDLRLHGNRPEMTREFVEKASENQPDVLITEGTRVDVPSDDRTEKRVYQESRKVVSKAKNLVIVDFNFKDVDRFRTFYKIAQETGRKMVISFKHACYLERYHQDKNLRAPDSTDENIMIMKPKLMTGTYSDEDYAAYHYIRDRLDYPNILTAEDVGRKQSEYMIVLNFWYFNQLVDIKPEQGSVYIHSLSEPFNEEMAVSAARQENWLEHFGLKKFQSHCSGHAPGKDLLEIAKTLSPKILFPVHTEHPGMFRKLTSKTKMIKEGKKYTV